MEGLKCQAEDLVFNSVGETELHRYNLQNPDS